MSDELKPCPFCGSHASVENNFGREYWVQCIDLENCGATNGIEYQFPADAVSAWNRRAQPERKLTDAQPAPTRLDVMSLIHSQMHRVYASAIDREEVDTQYMHEIEDAIRSLAAQPAAATVPEWISVEDRLPNKSQHVLMLIGNKVPVGFISKCEDGLWVSEYGHSLQTPTHWMPLPPPPAAPAQDDGEKQ